MSPHFPLFDPFIWLPWQLEKYFVTDRHYCGLETSLWDNCACYLAPFVPSSKHSCSPWLPWWLWMKQALSWVLGMVRVQHHVEVQPRMTVEPRASQAWLLISQVHEGGVSPVLLHMVCPPEHSILLSGRNWSYINFILETTNLLYGENANFPLIFKLYNIYKCCLNVSESLGVVNLLFSIIRVSLEKSEKGSVKAFLGLFGLALF